MENVIHRLTLDLTGPDMLPRIEVQQDNARTLVISLTQGGRPYWIAEGVTAVFSGRKPDGNPLFNACTIEKNRVRYDFTDQTTNVAGIVECEILLYSGDERILASPRFELAIDELIHRDGDVPESAPELSALTQMVAAGTAMIEDLRAALGELENVEEMLEQAQTAAQSATRSEEAATRAAGTAQSASSQAQASAQRAFSSAEGAAESLEKAIAAGKLTRQLQQQAEAARDSAGESAAQASGYAETASASAEQAGAALQQIGTVVGSSIESHNVGRYAHDDIRRELRALADRVNSVLNSDDATLDQLSEIVAYIKSNKTLIDAITTSKVSVIDIVNNLTTNVANKPLSAAQGVVLARRIETVRQITDEIERELADKLAADELPEAIENALAQAKESGEFDGAAGPQGPQGDPGPAGADGPPGDDYVLTDADRQEIAEIAAGLVEVPNVKPVAKTEDMTQPVGVDDEGRLWSAPTAGGSGGGTIGWEVLTDIELAEESAISPIFYDAKKYSAVHARLTIPKVSEKIAITNNFTFLHMYGLYWANVGDPNYGTCTDLRCEIMGAYMMEFFSNRPMSGVGNYANLQTRTTLIAAPTKFGCGGTAVFPAGTKLTVWGRM